MYLISWIIHISILSNFTETLFIYVITRRMNEWLYHFSNDVHSCVQSYLYKIYAFFFISKNILSSQLYCRIAESRRLTRLDTVKQLFHAFIGTVYTFMCWHRCVILICMVDFLACWWHHLPKRSSTLWLEIVKQLFYAFIGTE